jgi:hypothetical protein
VRLNAANSPQSDQGPKITVTGSDGKETKKK